MKTHLLLLSRVVLLVCVAATGPVLGEAIHFLSEKWQTSADFSFSHG